MDIGINLINLRNFFELTQTEVAKICGVTPSAVSNWESGKYYPRYKHIEAIAAHLGISPDSIITTEQKQEIDGSNELIALFALMNETGQAALLAAARGMAAAYPKNQGMEQTA